MDTIGYYPKIEHPKREWLHGAISMAFTNTARQPELPTGAHRLRNSNHLNLVFYFCVLF